MDMAQTIALSAGLAWASGLRLYLVVFLAGALSHLGYLHLPSTLDVLQNPLVIGRRPLACSRIRGSSASPGSWPSPN